MEGGRPACGERLFENRVHVAVCQRRIGGRRRSFVGAAPAACVSSVRCFGRALGQLPLERLAPRRSDCVRAHAFRDLVRAVTELLCCALASLVGDMRRAVHVCPRDAEATHHKLLNVILS